MGGGLESRGLGRVYGTDDAVRVASRTAPSKPNQKLGAENHMLQLNI